MDPFPPISDLILPWLFSDRRRRKDLKLAHHIRYDISCALDLPKSSIDFLRKAAVTTDLKIAVESARSFLSPNTPLGRTCTVLSSVVCPILPIEERLVNLFNRLPFSRSCISEAKVAIKYLFCLLA